MKISCGTDIIEIDRIKNAIDKTGTKFINEVFTPKEIDYCESKKAAKYEHYAGRFAAKEAIYKAISQFLDNKYAANWKNAEIINKVDGKPEIHFIGIELPQISSIDISISHCKTHASANVCIIFEGE